MLFKALFITYCQKYYLILNNVKGQKMVKDCREGVKLLKTLDEQVSNINPVKIHNLHTYLLFFKMREVLILATQ